MSLKYALFENHLTDDPDDYAARVQNLQSRSIDDIIDLMINRGSTVTKADIFSVLEDYSGVLEQCLRDGNSVNTPLFNLSPSIRGVFNGRDDPFDPARHQVRINVSPGTRLRKVETQIQLERVSPITSTPEVLEFEDVNSGSRNGPITPGGLGKLTGSRLKYEPNDTRQGIFFIDGAGAETRVTVISYNKPKSLHFQIPAPLATGAYTLEVRAVVRGSSNVRAGTLPHTLQVP